MQMMSVPELLRCPISLDLFNDPVTLSTGQTYDRASIEKWLAYGNLTCPVTMQRLHDTSFVPNHTLRHLIEHWVLANPATVFGHSSMFTAPIKSTDVTLSTLKHNLQFRESTTMTKLETLRIIKLLSSESSARQASLIREGLFELLLQVLFQFPVADNAEVIELALDGILNLSPSKGLESLNMLRNESNLVQLVFLLEQGNSRVKARLCYLLEAIASCSLTHELCLILGRRERLLQVLVSLLLDKSDIREATLKAICSLCSLEANRSTAIREGAMDGLVAYMSSAMCASRSRNRNVRLAVGTLEQLLALGVGKRRMSKMENGIMVLVKMVFRVPCDQRGSEHAVGALLLLCSDSEKARTDAINAGVLTQLLLLLQSQSGEQAKSKARALLKLLRAKWAKDQAGF
ncbi:U-box domain-containing protein 26-like [Curcuma longa]|uniref:U-box domain-containing protein 26-like n=1 Tax=Curcuma longa TaxID=136217 RepID=UPI003D9DCB57